MRVVIKREWQDAEIKVQFNEQGVSLEAGLSDFQRRFLEVLEVPKVALNLSQNSIDMKVKEAVKTALAKTISEMKSASKNG